MRRDPDSYKQSPDEAALSLLRRDYSPPSIPFCVGTARFSPASRDYEATPVLQTAGGAGADWTFSRGTGACIMELLGSPDIIPADVEDDFNGEERRMFASLGTPSAVQDFLDTIPRNHSVFGETCLTGLEALRQNHIHGIEGEAALEASTPCVGLRQAMPSAALPRTGGW